MSGDPSGRDAVLALLRRLEDAWNRADADAYGAAFTPDASYVAYFGTRSVGRDAIAAAHRALWRGPLRDTRMFAEVVEARFVSPDVALVTTRGDVARRRPRRLSKVQSYVAVRSGDGDWRIAHFQNTKRSRVLEWLARRQAPAAAR